MLGPSALFAASAAFTILRGVGAANTSPVSQEPPQPACTNSFQSFVYAGCFKDTGDPRALLYDSKLPVVNMTAEKCVAFCKGNNYRYAGLENHDECFCGATINGDKLPEADCALPCSGRKSEICGGIHKISIYQDPTFPVVNNSFIDDFQYVGCFSEGTSAPALAWKQDQLNATGLTTQKCLYACKKGGYGFGGVKYGSECHCGVVLGDGSVPVDPSSCNMGCPGAPTQACGGIEALDLYMAKDLGSSDPCRNTSLPSTTTQISSTSTHHSRPRHSHNHTMAMTTTSHQITTTTTMTTSTPCAAAAKRAVPALSETCEYECTDYAPALCPPSVTRWSAQQLYLPVSFKRPLASFTPDIPEV